MLFLQCRSDPILSSLARVRSSFYLFVLEATSLKQHMELAEWLVHWTPEIDSRVRCSARLSSMMHVIH